MILIALQIYSAIAVLVGISLSTEQAVVSDADVQMVGCFRAEAQTLDDGISDAGTVGRVVALACNSDIEKSWAQHAKGESQEVARAFHSRVLSLAPDMATQIVLQVRRGRVISSEPR